MNSNSFQTYLEALYSQHAAIDAGAVADYIPELLKADPAWFGIALVTVDGQVYQVGDTRQAFTIQSISKAISYGIALEDSGVQAVLGKIDVEPSGEAFNEISLEPGTGRPRNPMINAGAIATVALVSGDTPERKLERILKSYERYLGHAVTVDEDVYRSEKATGHRNRAIAYLLHNSNIIEKDTDEILDLYFKQCSILVTCRDLALIGASLANSGVNPITSERALQGGCVAKVLSVMASCGMYDYSGAWIYEIGMPAKSGVGGGIVAVLPGQFGLAVFSPKLDPRGNSVRGIAVCRKISADFGLHMFQTTRSTAASVIRSIYDAAQVRSKRTRNADQTKRLTAWGRKIAVFELQGDLVFASAEIVIREAMRSHHDTAYLILDFSRVSQVNEGAEYLLVDLIQELHQLEIAVVLTGLWDRYELVRALTKRVPLLNESPLLRFEDVDRALEWCEDQLLAEQDGFDEEQDGSLARQAFCAGFTADELAGLGAWMEPRSYQKGDYVCREGEPADFMFFILSGQVSVTVPLGNRRTGRLATLSAGLAFGEMALVEKGLRSADVVVDSPMHCLILRADQLEADATELGTRIKLKLVTNIARGLTQKLRQATLEIKSLQS